MPGLEDLYREIILDHYRTPRNRGELPGPPARYAEGHNPLCGDEITIYVDVKDGVVDDVKVAGPGGTPFAASQVDVGTNIAPSSANSFQVMTIVGGISAMIVLMLMASLIVIVVGYLGWVGRRLDGDAVAKDKGHKRDTGLVDEIDPDALVRRGRKGGKGVAAEPVAGDPLAEMFGGIGGAPVTVYAKGKYSDTYHGIEVFCDRVPGFRERQSLSAPQADGRRKAHIPIIPATRCRLVFQGNVPVRTYVTGGDVVTCTFDPIVCK